MSSDDERALGDPPSLRAIQARGYRGFRSVDLRLDGSFHVLVGPNGSGKSTLLDATAFLFDLFKDGLSSAVGGRTKNFQDLVWGRPTVGLGFELSAEFDMQGQAFRYEVRVEETEQGPRLVDERGYLGRLSAEDFDCGHDSVLTSDRRVRTNSLKLVFRRSGPNITVYGERSDDSAMMFHRTNESGLPLLRRVTGFELVDLRDGRPSAPRHFDVPVVPELAGRLMEAGVQVVQLDSRRLRAAAAPSGDDGGRLASDGGNLPRVIKTLRANRDRWSQWISHVRMALPEVQDIRTVHREDDRHDYLMVKYANGVEVPSWGVSDGTLRLLALTAIAYMETGHPTAYLLEEPENGIHPLAIEHVYRSLSSVYESQVFIASHSPTLLRCVKPSEVLCFANDPEGGVRIVPGDEHPRLRAWQESVDDELFWAADILT